MPLPTCFFCGEDVSPHQPGNFQYVMGWEKIRRRGEGGGHGLTERLPQSKWACAACMWKRDNHVNTNQGELL
jgi:hypothetical protein